MDKQVAIKVKKRIRTAKEEGTKSEISTRNRHRSSLSKIIKTIAQAGRFMKLSKSV